MLYPQFAHLSVAGAFYARRVRKVAVRDHVHQKLHNTTDAYLFFIGQARIPFDEMLHALDFPSQA